jgi:hypothetical protein
MRTYTWTDTYPEWVAVIFYLGICTILLGSILVVIIFIYDLFLRGLEQQNTGLLIIRTILLPLGAISVGFSGPLILSLTPILRSTVSPQGITMHYSILRQRRLVIKKEDIVGVFVTPLPAIEYTGRMGVFGKSLIFQWFGATGSLPFQPNDWHFCIASRSGLGVCIVTRDKKVMISCQDAEEAISSIIAITGASMVEAECPALWKTSLVSK